MSEDPRYDSLVDWFIAASQKCRTWGEMAEVCAKAENKLSQLCNEEEK